jgi:hypothetical protein
MQTASSLATNSQQTSCIVSCRLAVQLQSRNGLSSPRLLHHPAHAVQIICRTCSVQCRPHQQYSSCLPAQVACKVMSCRSCCAAVLAATLLNKPALCRVILCCRGRPCIPQRWCCLLQGSLQACGFPAVRWGGAGWHSHSLHKVSTGRAVAAVVLAYALSVLFGSCKGDQARSCSSKAVKH